MVVGAPGPRRGDIGLITRQAETAVGHLGWMFVRFADGSVCHYYDRELYYLPEMIEGEKE